MSAEDGFLTGFYSIKRVIYEEYQNCERVNRYNFRYPVQYPCFSRSKALEQGCMGILPMTRRLKVGYTEMNRGGQFPPGEVLAL